MSGAILSLVGLGLFDGDYWWLGLGLGALFGLVNWRTWRLGGPAPRWRKRLMRRFPAKPDGRA